jgi:hypothetical protein
MLKNKINKLKLSVLPEKLSICRLDANSQIPDWVGRGSDFFSTTKTSDELSVVCEEKAVPKNIKAENDWRAFKIEGPLDFSLCGILVSLLVPLAKAKISVFTISTYDTDYILVKEDKLDKAIQVLNLSV